MNASDFTHEHRAACIDERRHQFNITTPAERRASRKRFCEAALIVVGLGAFAACCYGLSSQPGAVPNQQAAPGAPLTAENAPVRWQRKDFDPSPRRVSGNTNKARRGASDNSPAPGSVLKRKAASK